MEKITFNVQKWTDFDVKVHHRSTSQVENRLLRGRAVVSPELSEMTFVENEPRGPRSVEVGRTAHSRFVRRPDGRYTLTFRFDATEPHVLPALLAEVRSVVKASIEDHKVESMKSQNKGAAHD